ncbi:MAG: oligosaccharide repeat unit polymerase [Nitrospira sp.]|nr:oligosaccharide repeat unit polymerase [Nitrospira sp.]
MEDPTLYLLLAVLTGIAAIPFGTLFLKKRKDIFEPVYWASAFFLLLFVVRAIFDLTLGSAFLSPPFDHQTVQAVTRAVLYLIPSLICFFIGYYSNFGRYVARMLPSLPVTWNSERVSLLLPLLICVGLISQFFLIQHLGGWSDFLDDKQRALTEPGQGYWAAGVSLIPLAFGVALTRCLVNSTGWILTCAVLFPLVLVLGLISGSKAAFLGPFLALLVSVHYLRRRVNLGVIVLFALLAILVFPLFNLYRQVGTIDRMVEAVAELPNNVFGGELPMEELGLMLVRGGMSRFLGIDSLTYIIRDTPEVMDFQYGRTILGTLFAWVPRQVWTDKPVGFAQLFGETYLGHIFYGTGTAAAPTLLGEAYLNGHIGGMVVVAVLCGVFVRSSYAYLIEQQFGQPAVFLYSCLFIHLFTFWERSIDGIVVATLILLCESSMLILLMGGRRPQNINRL